MFRRILLTSIALTPLALAACSSSPTSPSQTTPPPASACTYALGSTALNMAGVGGTASISVTTNSGCAWSVAASGSFIAITSASSNSGPGTVSIAVSENLGDARTGTITIGGQTVAVNQAAGDPVFGNWAGTIIKGAGCPALLPASASWNGVIRRSASGMHEFLINIPSALVFNQALSLSLNGQTLQIAVPVDTLYTFTATLATDRRSFNGVFSGGSCSGTWTGSRQ